MNINDNNILNDLNLLNKLENKEALKLLDYQEPHANKLIDILEKNNCALDNSDPGIGKTYIAVYICKMMNLTPIIICPKNVVSKWVSVLDEFKVNYIMVVNYELISRGKYYYKNAKLISPYIKLNKVSEKVKYEWIVDKNVIFIFDEAHRCKYLDTFNAKILLGAKETGNKILLLSATIVEKPIEFALFAYILNFSTSLKILIEWIKKLSAPAKTIHHILFDKTNPKAARLTIEELGNKFPDTQITADTYTMSSSAHIQKEYEKIAEKIKQYKQEGENSKFILAKLQNEFRNIELLKIPTFIELTEDYISNNYSVVIFVNYTDTLKLLSEKLKTNVLIYGGQSAKERDENIQKFQNDEARIIIANIKAGGIGISLHDLHGKHPRVSLISPTQSATNLIQALGRIHRSGGKTKSLQRIIFAANSPEENISKMLFRKLSNLSLLNDGTMESYYIDGLIEDDNKQQINDINKWSEKDLKMYIDDKMKIIKSKNIIKTDKLTNLFPKLIDTISGIRFAYLLQGKNDTQFKNKEIFLLGEDHIELLNCKNCNSNCIDIIDLISYVSYAIHPQKINVYLETAYRIYNKDKFIDSTDTTHTSRITKLYSQYQHLLNNKYHETENIKLHSVDIRSIKIDNYDNKTDEEINLYNLYYYIRDFIYDVLGYEVLIINDNHLIFKNNKELHVDYKNNKNICDKVVDTIKNFYEVIKINENNNYLNDIINGNKNIFDLFKITKQKNKFLENSADNIFNEKLEKEINLVFENNKKAKKYIYFWFNKFENFIHKNNEIIINEFMNIFYYDEKALKYINKYYVYSLNLFSHYMDCYSIYRMLRNFNGDKQNNIIFYGGYKHTRNHYNILHNTGYFSLVVRMINDNYDTRKEKDCVVMH